MLVERGFRASTIRIQLMNLRRFYDFCARRGVDKETTGRENPFDQVVWPKIRSYEKPTYLKPADERKLLRTIQRDPSVIGQRDYALFLMLLSTGRPAGIVRKLKWRDLMVEGEQAWMVDKEADKREAIPGAVWKAIENWFMASGRLGTMKVEDFVFAPSRAPLVREAGNQAEDWVKDRPLSLDEVHYLLKLYASWAGLNTEMVTCHTLRNTAALRMLARGENIQSIQTSMGRKDAAETRKYLKKLTQNGE
jgi:site-specific recombinase XerD